MALKCIWAILLLSEITARLLEHAPYVVKLNALMKSGTLASNFMLHASVGVALRICALVVYATLLYLIGSSLGVIPLR